MHGTYLWMCLKNLSNLTYTRCRNAPAGGKILRFDECAVYWRPLHDKSHSNPFSHAPNANIWRISINNQVDEITNHRYPWYVCFDTCQFTANGEPDVMNKRMTHPLNLHTFFHTHDAWIMTHAASEYVQRIVWIQLYKDRRIPDSVTISYQLA